MKRIFTLALSALAVVAAGAQVIWEGSCVTGAWGSNDDTCVKLDKGLFATASAGDKMEVTITAAGAEAKLVAKEGGAWNDLAGTEGIDIPAAGVYGIDLEQLTVDEAKAKGVILQGNAITITKVELKTSATVTYTTVWEGTFNASWDRENAPLVSADKCADLKDGDIIRFTVSAFGTADEWPCILLANGKTGLDFTPEIKIAAWDAKKAGKLPVELNYAVEDASIFKTDGFKAVVNDLTISKIEFGSKASAPVDPSEGTVLWEGQPTMTGWSSEIAVSSTKMAKVNVGDKVVFTVTAIDAAEEWPKVVMRDKEYNGLQDVDIEKTATVPCELSFVFTDAQKTATANGAAFLSVGCSITKIVAKGAGTDGIKDVIGADDAAAPVEYFNLQGVRVAEPAAGLYIRRQGKTVTKVVIR